jgi:hypothetical protein
MWYWTSLTRPRRNLPSGLFGVQPTAPSRPTSGATSATFLWSLPDCINRSAVRTIGIHAADDADAAERAFVTVMVWGHGRRNPRWRFRIPQIFATPKAGGRLFTAARTLQSTGPLVAYGRLADGGDCRLNGLGSAFATKYLSFCQPEGQAPRALIHDSNVSNWLKANGRPDLSGTNYSERRYGAYLLQMRDWAQALGCAADEAELCIFRASLSKSSQWADGCE